MVLKRTESVFAFVLAALMLVGCDDAPPQHVVELSPRLHTRCPKHTVAVKSDFIDAAYEKDWKAVEDAPDLDTAIQEHLIHPYVMVTCSDGSLSFTNGVDNERR